MFQKISLHHIRPYGRVSVDFERGINVLFGANGAGKTTILEAMYVLATTKSYRATKLFDLVSHEQPIGQIQGETTDFDTVQVDILPRKHIFSKNGDRVTRTSQFLHETKVVVLAPEHINLISGSGEKRRNYLDHLLCQKHPILIDTFKSYRKTVKQKQALLKQNLSFSDYKNQIEPWNQQLIHFGEEIRNRRKQLLLDLLPGVRSEYEEISQTSAPVDLIYHQREDSIPNRLKEIEFQEHRIKRLLAGPHRDDFEIQLKGLPAETTASQGERASILLSLKFSEMNHLSHEDSIPVMLLDDVGVTLDDERRSHLFERLEKLKPQTLITTPNPSIVENARGIGARILTQEKVNFQTPVFWK
ncbi:MAG: DNA replication and repair protein RecF [Bdellovibrionota bacterium]